MGISVEGRNVIFTGLIRVMKSPSLKNFRTSRCDILDHYFHTKTLERNDDFSSTRCFLYVRRLYDW
jgi:hypothetical protein